MWSVNYSLTENPFLNKSRSAYEKVGSFILACLIQKTNYRFFLPSFHEEHQAREV